MNRSYLYIFLIVLLTAISAKAQNTDTKIYNPQANAAEEIANAVKQANAKGKHVLLQVGGNWCSWCIRFHQLTHSDAQLDSAIAANYIVLKVNYSKENQNLKVLESLGYPQRFGFPVFVILDKKGVRLHTQNSAYLEEGKGYSKAKILDFLNQWSPAALNSETYKK